MPYTTVVMERRMHVEPHTYNNNGEMYYIGEFAEKGAVTVRTVRYYDQIGLLSPAHYTEAGQRLYTDEELATLQQIMALKLLGFSLREIQDCLQAGPQDLFRSLSAQKEMLREKRDQLDAIIQAIDEIENSAANGHVTWKALSNVMEMIQMEQKDEWVSKYFTPEQLETMQELSRKSYSDEAREKMAEWWGDTPWTEEDQRQVDEQYAQLGEGLEKAAREGTPAGSDEVQALAATFLDLIGQFTRSDAEVEAGLNKWWENHAALPDDQKPMGVPWGAEASALLDEAVEIYRKG
jgi:DNA-binding transcriptional MerR regulator